MGWKNVFHCEWNPFGQKILKHYWPDATSYTDITKTDFSIHRGTIDILTGGFPCQPYSVAGKRLGKEDDRHLWPEMLRAIGEIQPSWVVGENVSGLINWNGGMVFDEVQTDLEAKGYEVWAYVLPACAVNAPHRRDRVWFIAHANNAGANIGMRTNGNWEEKSNSRNKQPRPELRKDGRNEYVAHANSSSKRPSGTCEKTDCNRCKNNDEPKQRGEQTEQHSGCNNVSGYVAHANSRRQSCQEHRQTQSGWLAKESIPNDWQNWPTQPPVCSGNDGISSKLSGITFSKHRNESIKAYGNSVVVPLVHQIFKSIQEYENLTT